MLSAHFHHIAGDFLALFAVRFPIHSRQMQGRASRSLARLIDQLVRLRSLAIVFVRSSKEFDTDRRRVLMREGMRLQRNTC